MSLRVPCNYYLAWMSKCCVFTRSPLNRCRDHPAGALALVRARFPALRELELDSAYLDQPRAPLEHLTCLRLSNCCKAGAGAEPLSSFVAAAPRVEVLSSWEGRSNGKSVAEAAAGHPCLRELSLDLTDTDPRGTPAGEAWLRAAQQLPALESLALSLPSSLAALREEPRGVFTLRVLDTLGRLRHCERLAHLDLTLGDILSRGCKSLHELLAAMHWR